MAREELLLDLIARIYAAAENPSLWPDFLERLSQAVGGQLAAIASEDLRGGHASVAASVRFEDAPSRAYEEYYASKNVWMAAAVARASSGTLVTSQMLIPDRDLIKTEYYTDFLRKMNLRHLMGSIIFWDKNRLSHLSILRGGAGKEFRRAEVSLLTKLLPHFQQGLRLHGRLSSLQGERDALVNVMDRLSFGVFLLDRFGASVVVNRAGSEIVASRDGLSSVREGLSASRAEENRRLARSIAGVTSSPTGASADCGGVLSISRPSGRRAYSVLVTRLSPSEATFGELRPVAAVFVTDPDRNVRTDRAVLRELYGFTAAEALFACKLMQGESVDEAAEDLEVSINTARTHVRHLLEKTETHTHRELVRQLLLGCSQIQR